MTADSDGAGWSTSPSIDCRCVLLQTPGWQPVSLYCRLYPSDLSVIHVDDGYCNMIDGVQLVTLIEVCMLCYMSHYVHTGYQYIY